MVVIWDTGTTTTTSTAEVSSLGMVSSL